MADFGLARLTGDGRRPNLTQVGITMGTPLYMSPEQVEGRPLDPRSDIYSFGVTCYHMLAGEPPFRGDTALSVAVQHVQSAARAAGERAARPAAGPVPHRAQDAGQGPEGALPDARELLRELRSLEIEGVSGDWPVELDERNTTEAAAPNQSTLEATRRLDTLMRTQALSIRGERRWRWRIAAAVAVAFVLGGAAARVMRKPLILDTSAAGLGAAAIEQQKAAAEQYLFAVELGTEAAWKSVRQFFPNDNEYTPRADQQLARLYLDNGRYEEALKLFQKFAHNPPLQDNKYKAFGLTGECLAYYSLMQAKETPKSLRDKYKANIAKAGGELLGLSGGAQCEKLGAMLDRQMARNVSDVLKNINEATRPHSSNGERPISGTSRAARRIDREAGGRPCGRHSCLPISTLKSQNSKLQICDVRRENRAATRLPIAPHNALATRCSALRRVDRLLQAFFGCTPTKRSTTSPPLKIISVGMLLTP